MSTNPAKPRRGRPPGPGTGSLGKRPDLAGAQKARKRPEHQREAEPDDPLERALEGEVDAAEWEQLRATTWQQWAELVSVEPMSADELEALRESADLQGVPIFAPVRDTEAVWPPGGARHDGLSGDVLCRRWNTPDGYQGKWDARDEIVALAEAELVELDRFRRRKAAKPIRPELTIYARLLRHAARHPEARLRSE